MLKPVKSSHFTYLHVWVVCGHACWESVVCCCSTAHCPFMYLDPGRVEWEVNRGFGGKRYIMINAIHISLTLWFNYGYFSPFYVGWYVILKKLGVFTSCPQNSSSRDECEKKRTMLGHGLSETTFSSKLWHGVLGRVVDEVWKQPCPGMHGLELCPRPPCTGKGVHGFSIQLTPNLHQMCVHCFFATVRQRDW